MSTHSAEVCVANYEGSLRIEGDGEPPIRVDIDLDDERIRLAAGEVELGDWALSEIRVDAMTDGFHVRVEGQEIVIEVEEDGRFALDLGLTTGHPALRRRMAALLREQSKQE